MKVNIWCEKLLVSSFEPFDWQLKFDTSPSCKLFHAIYLILLEFCNFYFFFLCSMYICNCGNHEVNKSTVDAFVAHQDSQMFKWLGKTFF